MNVLAHVFDRIIIDVEMGARAFHVERWAMTAALVTAPSVLKHFQWVVFLHSATSMSIEDSAHVQKPLAASVIHAISGSVSACQVLSHPFVPVFEYTAKA